MLLFANSLDGVGGCLVSGLQPGMNGLEDISRVGRILRTPGAHPNLKEEPCGDSRRRLSGGAKLRSLFSTLRFQKFSMEDERPRPSRFEYWRASKFPSRHPEPRRGRLVRPDERSSATHGIVIPNEPHLRTEESGRASNLEEEPCQSSPQLSSDKSPKPLQKHGKSGVTTPTTNLLKMVFWSCAYVPLAGIRM